MALGELQFTNEHLISVFHNLFPNSNLIRALFYSQEKGKETVILIACYMKYDVSLSVSRILVSVEVYVLSNM